MVITPRAVLYSNGRPLFPVIDEVGMSDKENEHVFAPPDTSDEPTGSNDEDYTFRFRLEPLSGEKGYEDPLLELIRGQIADLLHVVTLTYHGNRVMVDGFRLFRDEETQYDVFPDSTDDGKEDVSSS